MYEYCKNVVNKKIIAGRYTIESCKRTLDDLKSIDDDGFPFTFNLELFNVACKFAESLYYPDQKGNIKLLPWQLHCYTVWAWVYKADEKRRRFRKAYICVARKNGKTSAFLTPWLLLDFITSNSAESYLFASDDAQANKIYSDVAQVIQNTKGLKEKIECLSNAIVYGTSRIACFSSSAGGIDGYRTSLAILDEYHEYRTDHPQLAMQYGTRSRKNGLVAMITSAGLDISSACYNEELKCKKILDKIQNDNSYFGIVYSYDDKDSWRDTSLLLKSNPSMGSFLLKENLISDEVDAESTPSHVAEYKSKTCGIWVNSGTSWIPIEKWNVCRKPVDFEKGVVAYGALDLSMVNDLTGFTLCWFGKDGKANFKHHVYIPEEQIIAKYKKDNAQFPDWIDAGYITVTSGGVVDYDYILEDLKKERENFIIKELAYDKWNASNIITKMNDVMPDINYIAFDQSLKNMSPPTKEFERMALIGLINDPNPVMNWCINNVEIKKYRDSNDNYKPSKKGGADSNNRIDLVITSIMALNRAEANNMGKDIDMKKILSIFD